VIQATGDVMVVAAGLALSADHLDVGTSPPRVCLAHTVVRGAGRGLMAMSPNRAGTHRTGKPCPAGMVPGEGRAVVQSPSGWSTECSLTGTRPMGLTSRPRFD
jgi:hypothetical protein